MSCWSGDCLGLFWRLDRVSNLTGTIAEQTHRERVAPVLHGMNCKDQKRREMKGFWRARNATRFCPKTSRHATIKPLEIHSFRW
jgi:hypothetical protein